MKKTLIALFATASVFAGVSAASADDTKAGDGSHSANLVVQANLKEGCSINFGGGDSLIDFGTISSLDKEWVKHGQFNISCSALKGQTTGYKALPVKLTIGSGRGSEAPYRFLDNGDTESETLPFQVYQGNIGTSSGGTIWGDQTTGNFKSYPVDVASTSTVGKGQDYDYTVILLTKKDLTKNTAGTYKSTMVATVDYSKAQ